MRIISRTILMLSLVSLFTDLASEMLYPILPMYLRSIGFSVAIIGLLEGVAEVTAGLSKGYFGNLSDLSGRRRPFVQIGYGLSALSKPLMAVLTAPLWIFGVRTVDRLGKGIRTGARDAMLSAETTPEFKGRVFGFHRGFDTLGAVLGPAAALLFLSLRPGDYRMLFVVALVPGLLAVLVTSLLKERPMTPRTGTARGPFAFVGYWRRSPASYRSLVRGLLAFALINSSDMLLLLLMRERGASDVQVVGIYIVYNLVYAFASYPMGALGDRLGLKRTFVAGLVLFAVVYGGMTIVDSPIEMVLLFCAYGLYAAATEGISKAWITNLVPADEAATAVGFYTGFQSVAALIASAAAGAMWAAAGPGLPFVCSSVGALLTAAYTLFFCIDRMD